MMASLYQVESWSTSNRILRAQTAFDVKYMCGRLRGIELHVVPTARAPLVLAPIEEIVHCVGRLARYLYHRQVDPARLPPDGIQVHDGRDHVRSVRGDLGVGEQVLVVRVQEAKRPVVVQRWMLSPDRVDPGDEWTERAGPVQLPVTDLILLRAQVVLPTRRQRRRLHQLERGSVHAVAGTQGRGQHEAQRTACPAARLYELGEDIRRVGPEIGAKEVPRLAPCELGEIL